MPCIALVGPELEENLSLRYLASSLSAAGFESVILPFNGEGSFGPVLQGILGLSEPPLVVALSLAFQWRAMDCLALAAALREAGYRGHITGGGHFGTFECRALLRDFPELDSVCRHEAEEILVELARALRDGASLEGITGLAGRGAEGQIVLGELRRAPELATLPWPDRRGEPMSCLGHRIATLVGSRGCYANCAFCCIAAWHQEATPGKRYRLRPIEDLADEMVWLQKSRDIDTFIFHDDNFFVPGHAQSLARINGLADALQHRGMGRFSTVVKARPTDVTEPVFRAMKERLGLTRLFLGIETDADQGLTTLRRSVHREQNHGAMKVLDQLGLYVCFNLLVFDPDTTLESLETNLAFMQAHAQSPFNFGRVELYAGTPLLERMQEEGRCTGDYLGWDYRLATPQVQRAFELTLRCFFQRNFAAGALANRLMGTHFDVELARFFHPEQWRAEWGVEAKSISRELALDSVRGLRRIIAFVRDEGRESPSWVSELSSTLRQTERALLARAEALEHSVQSALGRRCVHALPPPVSVAAQLQKSPTLVPRPGSETQRQVNR